MALGKGRLRQPERNNAACCSRGNSGHGNTQAGRNPSTQHGHAHRLGIPTTLLTAHSTHTHSPLVQAPLRFFPIACRLPFCGGLLCATHTGPPCKPKGPGGGHGHPRLESPTAGPATGTACKDARRWPPLGCSSASSRCQGMPGGMQLRCRTAHVRCSCCSRGTLQQRTDRSLWAFERRVGGQERARVRDRQRHELAPLGDVRAL